MKRGDALSMRQTAERSLLVDVCSVIEQPRGSFCAIARRSPNQGSSPIWVGIQPRAGSEETVEHTVSSALRCPYPRLIEHFLRFRRRLPIRKAAMRAVETSRGAGFRRQGAFARKACLD